MSDITTLTVITANIILQEVGYFENSTFSSSFERARPLLFKVAKFQTWKMKIVAVIVLTRTFRLTQLTEDW
jgi:hypothetical protein